MNGQITHIQQLGGIIFLAYTIMAAAYWTESGRWSDKAERTPDEGLKQRYLTLADRAERTFKVSTIMMVFTIMLVVVPFYVQAAVCTIICKWLLLAPLAGILIMSFRYMAGRYVIPLRLTETGRP